VFGTELWNLWLVNRDLVGAVPKFYFEHKFALFVRRRRVERKKRYKSQTCVQNRTLEPVAERRVRALVRKHWHGWSDWLEPTGSAGVGRPDLDVLVDGRIVPVELKVMNGSADGWICCEKIRPTQISWHFRFNRAGGISLWLFGHKRGFVLTHQLVDIQQNNTAAIFRSNCAGEWQELDACVRSMCLSLCS
jgi:hypothetical protein